MRSYLDGHLQKRNRGWIYLDTIKARYRMGVLIIWLAKIHAYIYTLNGNRVHVIECIPLYTGHWQLVAVGGIML